MKFDAEKLAVFQKTVTEKLHADKGPGTFLELLSDASRELGADAAFLYSRDRSEDTIMLLRLEVGLYNEKELPLLLSETASDIGGEGLVALSVANYEEKLCRLLFPDLCEKADPSNHLLCAPIYEGERMSGFVGMASREGVFAGFDRVEKNWIELVVLIAANFVKARYYLSRSREYSLEALERIIDTSGVDIYVTDFYTDEILYVNESMAAPYGGVEAMIGKICYKVLYKDQFEECSYCPKYKLLDENGRPTKRYSWDYQRPFDGSWFRVFSSAFELEPGRFVQVITSSNITENKEAELRIKEQALNDALTGISNRRCFEIEFDAIIGRSLDGEKPGYILFVDLDNFKYINDAFGHEAGDKLLIKVANYLQHYSAGTQRVYRYGGDEFIVVIENISHESVVEFINILLGRFNEPWDLDGVDFFCTVSIGAASFPDDGVTQDDLLKAADHAMYEAKKLGKSTVVFSKAGYEGLSEMVQMEFALRRAILDGCVEFELEYHPIVDMNDDRYIGGETLVRWNSAKFGLVKPSTFIPMCEKLGLILELEKWAVTNALKDVQKTVLGGVDDFILSVNVSAREFHDSRYSDYVISLLDDLNFPRHRLMLEMNEYTSKIDLQMKEISDHVERIRAQGVKVAFDGFGIASDSLQRIQELRVDFIKIDRKFVTDSLDDNLKTAVVKAIIMLAHAAGSKVCAEGAETAEHVQHLKEIGCEYIQGIYYSKPKPILQFVELFLEANKSK